MDGQSGVRHGKQTSSHTARQDLFSSRKMKAKRLLSERIIFFVLLAGLVLFLTNLPDPGIETTGTGNFQATENQSLGPDLENATPRPPPRERMKPEATFNPDPAENSDLQSTPPVTVAPFPVGDGPFSISGLVIDESGKGVPGIEVLATWKNLFPVNEDLHALKGEHERKALTGTDGFYEIQGLEDGEYRIGTLPDDRYEAAQAVFRAGVDTADLVLREWRPDVSVFGTVLGDGEPLDNVQVMAMGQSDGAVYTNADGFYEYALELSKSKPAYSLQFVREGYREKRSILEMQEMVSAGQIRVDTELEPARDLVEVSGTVLNKRGKPVPGETVQLYSQAARQRYSVVSDRNGELWFSEVETSPDYMLSVHPTDSYRDFVIHDVDITLAGADLEVVLEPLNIGSLSGQMLDPNGLPVPEFRLWLRNPDAINQAGILVTGDQQGYFAVDEIEEGDLIFETRSSPQYNISGIHLSAGEELEVRLVLDWGNHQVAGVVVDDTGAPIAASELFVTSFRRDGGLRTHAIRKAITDEAGYFLFTQVGPGYHTIRSDVAGFHATILDHYVGSDNPEVIIGLERASFDGM